MAACGCDNIEFKCCDTEMVNQLCLSCPRFLVHLKNPFNTVGIKQLVKAEHGGDAGFGAWSALEYYVSIVSVLVFHAMIALWVEGAMGVVFAAGLGYLMTHVTWFSIVERPMGGVPCCWGIFCCCACKCVPLIDAIFLWIFAVCTLINPFNYMEISDTWFLLFLPAVLYAPFLFYQGISAFKIWKEQMAGIVGESIKAPAAQTVMAEQVPPTVMAEPVPPATTITTEGASEEEAGARKRSSVGMGA